MVAATSATMARPRVVACGIDANAWIVDRIYRGQFDTATDVCIERFTPRGMRIGNDSIETIHWSGRIYEAVLRQRGTVPYRISRDIIKRHLCGTTAVKDKHVRAAIMARYTTPQCADPIGLPSAPGPLYDLREHAWSAMAVALVFLDTEIRYGAS